MATSNSPCPEDVEQLLLNARLRDELEPFFDESIHCLDTNNVPTSVENEFLASMLAWEKAPVLPISQWFLPELMLPAPESLGDEELHEQLWDAIQRLFDKRIVLDFTDHLTDRQLYTLIVRDILPAQEKKLDLQENYLHWDCADSTGDAETWLRYYASDEERQMWLETHEVELPPSESPPYARRLPKKPL
jgi:hypothetical protein